MTSNRMSMPAIGPQTAGRKAKGTTPRNDKRVARTDPLTARNLRRQREFGKRIRGPSHPDTVEPEGSIPEGVAKARGGSPGGRVATAPAAYRCARAARDPLAQGSRPRSWQECHA